MNRIRILILDDDSAIREELGEFLIEKKFETHTASLPSEAMEILKEREIDIAIIDVKLPEKDGISALKDIRQLYPDLEVIMISGHGDMEMVISAMRAGANDFFLKPFRSIDVENAIERTKRFLSISKELREVKSNYE